MPTMRNPDTHAPVDIVEIDGDLVTLDPHWSRIVLDVTGYGYGGYASGFAAKVVELGLACDGSNLSRLRLAFPEAAEATYAYKMIAGGVDALRMAASK